MAPWAPVGPVAGPNHEDLDSMGREGEERRRITSVQRPDLALERGWGHLEFPLGRMDQLSLVTALGDGDVVEEEEEEASQGWEPREHLCWSREVVSC